MALGGGGLEALTAGPGGGVSLSLDYLQLAELAGAVSVMLQQITHTTNPDWDAVAPDSTRVDLSSPTENDNVGSMVVGANDITIGKAGRYEVIVAINGQLDAANDYAQLVLNGLTGSVLAVAMLRTNSVGNTNGPVAALVWQGTLAVNDTLDVRIDGSGAEVTVIRAYSISIKELP